MSFKPSVTTQRRFTSQMLLKNFSSVIQLDRKQQTDIRKSFLGKSRQLFKVDIIWSKWKVSFHEIESYQKIHFFTFF